MSFPVVIRVQAKQYIKPTKKRIGVIIVSANPTGRMWASRPWVEGVLESSIR